MFISSRRTRWPMAPISTTSAPNTTAAPQIDPPFFQELVRSEKSAGELSNQRLAARLVKPLDDYLRGSGRSHRKTPAHVYFLVFAPRISPTSRVSAANLKAQQDAVSKFIYSNLSPKLSNCWAKANDKRAVNAVCKDLNMLLDRELQTKDKLARRESRERCAWIRKAALRNGRKNASDELEKEIAELSKIPTALRTGAVQGRPDFRVSAGFHQGKPAKPYARAPESAAAGSSLSEGNRQEPRRRLSGPRNLYRHARRFATLFPGLSAGRATAVADSTN